MLFKCSGSARLLPEKLSVYTTLVGLLNARNYNFGGEFVEAMIRQLKETLKSNLYSEAAYLVRSMQMNDSESKRPEIGAPSRHFILAGRKLICCRKSEKLVAPPTDNGHPVLGTPTCDFIVLLNEC